MNRIREFRKRRKMTLKELGVIVNVAESTISKYENGINEPDLKTLSSIADALEVSVDDLLGRAQNTYAEEEASKKQDDSPKTKEARIVSFGMDQLPEDERQKILTILQTMYTNNPALFKRSDADDA